MPAQGVDVCSCRPDEDPLARLIVHAMDPRDACVAAQVCKTWSSAASQDWWWRQAAQSTFPDETLTLREYHSYKAMVLDDNAHNCVLSLTSPPKSCLWKGNTSSRYYACRVLGCEISQTYIRIAYDARGEWDLRNPNTSTLAIELVTPYSTASSTSASGTSNALSGGHRAANTIVRTGPSRELSLAAQPGHHKGILEWGQDALLLLCNAAAQRVCNAQPESLPEGTYWRLAFIFAGTEWTDYHAVELLGAPLVGAGEANKADRAGKADGADEADGRDRAGETDEAGGTVPLVGRAEGQGPRNSTLMRTWRENATHVATGSLERSMAQQSEEEDRAAWRARVPEGVRERFDEWYSVPRARADGNAPAWRRVLVVAPAWILGHEWNMAQMEANHAQEEEEEEPAPDHAFEWHMGQLVAHDEEDDDEGNA